ncbi:MAG: type I phosphomannose isomerase catalytic subunit [Cytophagaceae bacterium]
MKLYPLTFEPILKDKIWGGKKLKGMYNKEFDPLPNCGESWEISGVEGNVSKVSNGPLKGRELSGLIDSYKDKLVGAEIYKKYKTEFPLLIKFLDANDDLSIQVHPDDQLALQKHRSLGKTEMWYILQADEGARLNTGFSKEVNKAEFIEHVNNNTLDEILNFEEVKPGDVFFLPAGRIHYIGKGICLAEIQQTSDITYRVYDFDRTDDKGNKRELHLEDAVDAMDFKVKADYKTNYTPEKNKPSGLVKCPYFTSNIIDSEQAIHRNYGNIDSFVIYIVLEGNLKIQYDSDTHSFRKGETVLLPAEIKKVSLNPGPMVKLLEVYIDQNLTSIA